MVTLTFVSNPRSHTMEWYLPGLFEPMLAGDLTVVDFETLTGIGPVTVARYTSVYTISVSDRLELL